MDRGIWRATVLRDAKSRKDTTKVTEHARTHDLKRQAETTVPVSPHPPGRSRSEDSISQSASGREICIRPASQEFRPRGGTAVAKPECEVERVQFGVQGGGTGTVAQPKARSCVYPTLRTSSSFFENPLRSEGSLSSSPPFSCSRRRAQSPTSHRGKRQCLAPHCLSSRRAPRVDAGRRRGLGWLRLR